MVAASGFLKGRCGLVVISGFFGTGWPIWLQVRLLFPEIATIPPPKP
ncbi:phosphatidylglycerophosphatase [Mobiluncus mulieris]|nr:phosphatidylglycerophosphatase [Mobiluncus mulieris]MCU9975712.1 phosphatidylglycerophosphatase [Mobiluncus mulieris]MCU9993929.1 phosphatidylglycerophosphatase [Mobiluncus mulieris]MCV0002366.1 phosphatidylglycerophosphatase [Mobiluncus mulieris]MCV0011411.1 phosphatidylglycerophosphatase [Mobiluncus mulieris]